MLKVGGEYLCRVGSYINRFTTWKIERHDGTHWVARSQDSFESEVYLDDDGRHVGSRDLGMYGDPIEVFMVPIL